MLDEDDFVTGRGVDFYLLHFSFSLVVGEMFSNKELLTALLFI